MDDHGYVAKGYCKGMKRMKDFLEDWIYKSIKPIDISCECNMILGIPDYKTTELLVELAPTMMILSLALRPIVFLMTKIGKNNEI